MNCPNCTSRDIRRSRKKKLIDHFVCWFGHWPYRCRACHSRFCLATKFIPEDVWSRCGQPPANPVDGAGHGLFVDGFTFRVTPAEAKLAAEIIDRGFRACARAYHPDLGGDSDAMRRLNAVAFSMRQQLQG